MVLGQKTLLHKIKKCGDAKFEKKFSNCSGISQKRLDKAIIIFVHGTDTETERKSEFIHETFLTHQTLFI